MMAEIAELNHRITELQDNLAIEKSNTRELRRDLKVKTDLIEKLESECLNKACDDWTLL
jgi:hypothetical protein